MLYFLLFNQVVKGLGETLVGAYPGRAMSFICKKNALDSPQLLGYPSKPIGLFISRSIIFRSDSNGEDLEGYAGAGLQGGLLSLYGISGVGIGNFQEVGPLDTSLNLRNSTWLQKSDLLFVDDQLELKLHMILPHCRRSSLMEMRLFKRVLFSLLLNLIYGGKFAVTLALSALKVIEAGKLKLKLGGVALGDSWISPEDFVFSWGPLIKDVSRLDDNRFKQSQSYRNYDYRM
ncbi:hypothetical protein F8388_004437 [Cannabis sativa]|uniref:Uncharacterized protein n=1 Tax=Cannabis sativa TaxID=3483 RepID=A0A7J6HBW7_CANSA|nr:hypothetical protein F8388_004437 [Cannabis sativa]